ncbi:MAG: 2,3-bisphosphoglycerate-independent phosphoglycerate mutase [bacterium]
MAKGLIIIGDGMAGRPVRELGGKTTLEASGRPNLDSVASEGICGIADPVSPGLRVGSDTSHLALLGYDPFKYYTGRGPFEAMGVGLDVRPGDIAFRMNFATIDSKGIVIDRRAGRIQESEGTGELASLINGIEIDNVKILCRESTAHRGAVVLHGDGLLPYITDTDPHIEGKPVLECKPLTDDAKKTADVVNKLTKIIIDEFSKSPINERRINNGKRPANVALLRGAGLAPIVEPFKNKYGINGSAVVEVGLIKGIARYLGLELIDAKGATGGMDTSPVSLADATIEALGSYDFVLINMKAPDLGGHDGDYKMKIEAIEMFDEMVGLIINGIRNIGDSVHLIITADHATPISFKDHTGDIVPFVVWGENVLSDDVSNYSERACMKGGAGRIRFADFLPILFNLMGITEKFGA